MPPHPKWDGNKDESGYWIPVTKSDAIYIYTSLILGCVALVMMILLFLYVLS